jgi:hypothetical protein
LLFLNEAPGTKPTFKLFKFRLNPVPKTLKVPMPSPTIFHSILPRLGDFTPYFGEQIPFSRKQQPGPRSAHTESGFELCPPAVRNPKPSIHYKLLIRLLMSEPRGVQSFRRPLHLRDDFLRDGTRSLLITRKVH